MGIPERWAYLRGGHIREVGIPERWAYLRGRGGGIGEYTCSAGLCDCLSLSSPQRCHMGVKWTVQ